MGSQLSLKDLARRFHSSLFGNNSGSIKVPETLVVDIIVPVYRGLTETQECLESVFRSQSKTHTNLIVIDDCSPEPALTKYLQELAAQGQIKLVTNESNKGFAATVSAAMALNLEHDIILLNSDTQVANDWIDRMVSQAYSNKRVGTVTPFSNSATICSYPAIGDNVIPVGESVDSLDLLVRELNAGKNVSIPTGVGFCMYIRRQCLTEIGYFDLKNFSEGYGEENDFCMRATEAGWSNIFAADVFVYHKGSVSFAETHVAKRKVARERFLALYSSYDQLIGDWLSADPAKIYRDNISVARLARSKKACVLFVNHRAGGGTQKHINDLVGLLGDKANFLELKPSSRTSVLLSWINAGEMFQQEFALPSQYKELVQLLKSVNCKRIHFHHFWEQHELLKKLPNDLNVRFDFTIHDYFALCPQIHLVNYENKYCGLPDSAECNKCIQMMPPLVGEEVANIDAWRNKHAWLITDAERVLVPSYDVANKFKRYYPNIQFIVVPHLEQQDISLPPERERLSGEERLRIVVLGAIFKHKGADLLEQCAIDAFNHKLPIEFHLFGKPYREMQVDPLSRLIVHGEFQTDKLDDHFDSIRPHLAWFPSRGPETYSYTLSFCLHRRLPIAASDIGSLPERLKGRSWTWLKPADWEAENWNALFKEIRFTNFLHGRDPMPTPPGSTRLLDSKRSSWYAKSYLEPIATASTEIIGARK